MPFSIEEILREKLGQSKFPMGRPMPSHSPPMEETKPLPSHERGPQYFSPTAEEIKESMGMGSVVTDLKPEDLRTGPHLDRYFDRELPANNEEELREHQRKRNDISAAMPPPPPSLEVEQPPTEQLPMQEKPVVPQQEETFDPGQLDFSKINELSQGYQEHLGALPEREGQGLGRKLLSVLLGYGASLGGGGLAHGYSVGKGFYDQPYNEKMQDWGMREKGMRGSIDDEFSRLGEEGDFLNESQDNQLDFMKYEAGRGDTNREAALARDKFDFGQSESGRDYDFEVEGRDRAIVESDREHNLAQDKENRQREYGEEWLSQYSDRTDLMGKTEPGISLDDEQNTIREIMIENPELVDAFVKDQDGDFYIPKVDAPEGGWIFGPSDEEESGYQRNSQLSERARRLLQEKLQGGEEEATEEIDFQELVEMIRGGAI